MQSGFIYFRFALLDIYECIPIYIMCVSYAQILSVCDLILYILMMMSVWIQWKKLKIYEILISHFSLHFCVYIFSVGIWIFFFFVFKVLNEISNGYMHIYIIAYVYRICVCEFTHVYFYFCLFDLKQKTQTNIVHNFGFMNGGQAFRKSYNILYSQYRYVMIARISLPRMMK